VSERPSVAVIGIGRVGLPFALYLADRGHQVFGIDVDADRVATLEAGRMPFLEEGAPEVLARVLGTRFTPTLDDAAAGRADVVVLTLGTPVDDHLNPDFDALESVVAGLVPHVRPGQLFLLRSTVTPGTTEYVRRFLEERTGRRVGEDLFLAFCPERIAQGYSFAELPRIPQLVGALDDESRRRAAAFFEGLSGPVLPSGARAAEIAKLFCNVYRYIDFAIGNEFMMLAEQQGCDIYEVRRLVNEGYPRGGLKAPGFTGGPCLYKDGFFLIERTPFPDLLTTAWKINESVPGYLIEGLRERLGPLEGKVVLILGLAFKRDIDDGRNSLAFKAIKILKRQGAEVLRHDPYLAPEPLGPLLERADALIVATNHREYRDLDPAVLGRARPDALLVDVWDVFGTGRIYSTAADARAGG